MEMKKIIKRISLLCLFASLSLMFGCAQMAARKAVNELNAHMERLSGWTEEEVVLALGVPQNIHTIGSLKIYQYHDSLGQRSNGYFNTLGYGVVGNSHTWEAYDRVDITFKNGRVSTWRCWAQR